MFFYLLLVLPRTLIVVPHCLVEYANGSGQGCHRL